MKTTELIILALTLAIDSFLAMIAIGCLGKNKRRIFISLAIIIGIFHFAMPLAGNLVSSLFQNILSDYAKYISSAVFLFLGIKMIIEAFKHEKPKYNLSFIGMLGIGYLLSIDALAAGFSIGLISSQNIFLQAGIIAVSSFIFGYAGSILGRRCSTWNTKILHLIGGGIFIILAF